MADNGPPQPTQDTPGSPTKKKHRFSKLEVAGKLKAKAISSKKPSKVAEKEASRRHLALERLFSRVQRLCSSDTGQVSPAPPEVSLFGPQPPPTSSLTQRAWSPEGEAVQEEGTPPIQGPCPRRVAPSPRDPPGPEATFTSTQLDFALLSLRGRGHSNFRPYWPRPLLRAWPPLSTKGPGMNQQFH